MATHPFDFDRYIVPNYGLRLVKNTLYGKINYVGVEGQYSTVLAVINAFRGIKSYPISIQKAGNAAYTDLPVGVTNTCEWNVICYGSNTRIVAELTIYTGGGDNNKKTYTALIYDGSYINNWSLSSGYPFDFLRNNNNDTSYTFALEHCQNNGFRTGLVISSDQTHPGVWLIAFGTGETPTTKSILSIYKDSSTPLLTGISLAKNAITLTFGSTVYGGVRVIWLN